MVTPPLLAVCKRIERVLRLGQRMNRHGHSVLDREPSVPGDVVRVRVRLEHPLDANALRARLFDQRLDRERRVDDDGDAGFAIAHQVGRAAEIVVHELREEQHRRRA